MRMRWSTLPVVLLLAATTAAMAIDQIKTTNKEKSMIRAKKVIAITPQEVEIEPVGAVGLTEKLPVNKIVSIFFEDEPQPLRTAREHMMHGEYSDAMVALEKLAPEEGKRREIVTEIEYAKAFCAARLALAGNGSVVEAGKQMYAFLNKNPSSFHFYEANELAGHLLVASGKYDSALSFYDKLAKAPWPDYSMRAKVAIGRALLAQKKPADAEKAFDEAIGSLAAGDLADDQRMSAQLGKARCWAAGQKAEQAVKLVETIIAKADPDNIDLHAQAYNALGTALRKAGKPKEAVLAFLHVDLLYAAAPDAHAEALANLVDLFTELHKADHASRCKKTLEESYPDSPWLKGK